MESIVISIKTSFLNFKLYKVVIIKYKIKIKKKAGETQYDKINEVVNNMILALTALGIEITPDANGLLHFRLCFLSFDKSHKSFNI